MARRTYSHKGKRNFEGQYTALPYALLRSEAWRSLSGAAVKVFLELNTRFNGGNNGNLRLSMNEAAEALGLGKATVQRAFQELQDKGFIAQQRAGSWYHRKTHEWRLTTKPTLTPEGRKTQTDDWKSWRKKTERGSGADPSPAQVVPFQNRRDARGSTTEPVTGDFPAAFGSGMEH